MAAPSGAKAESFSGEEDSVEAEQQKLSAEEPELLREDVVDTQES